jgi:serine kinase of HPr protein (carbohydrate metabolism regulator)
VLQLLQSDGRARLVADDRTVLLGEGGRLLARPAPGLEGLLEIRGLGIAEFPRCNGCAIDLVVHILPVAECPRLPGADESVVLIAGLTLPRLCLPVGFHAGPSRIAAALQLLADSPDCLLRSGVDWSKLSRRSINAAEPASQG